MENIFMKKYASLLIILWTCCGSSPHALAQSNRQLFAPLQVKVQLSAEQKVNQAGFSFRPPQGWQTFVTASGGVGIWIENNQMPKPAFALQVDSGRNVGGIEQSRQAGSEKKSALDKVTSVLDRIGRGELPGKKDKKDHEDNLRNDVQLEEALLTSLQIVTEDNWENIWQTKSHVEIGKKKGLMLEFRDVWHKDSNERISGRVAVAFIDDSRIFIMIGMSPSDGWNYNEEFDAVLRSVKFASR